MNPNIIKEIIEWIACIAVAVTIALLVRYFVGTPTIVQNISMKPTLIQGERLLLNRVARTIKEPPERGEIITIEAPSQEGIQSNKVNNNNPKAIYDRTFANIFERFIYEGLEIGKVSYIKRVVALEGEHVVIKEGKVFINDKELEENYLQQGIKTEGKLNDFIVPQGYVFAMGDNRENSLDCRNFGCIPLEKVESKVWIRIWPFNRFGKIK